MATKSATSKQKSMGLGAALLAVLLILALTLAPAPTDTQAAANIQPELLALAAGQPDAQVRVIIQKSSQNDFSEQIEKLGGTVIRNLRLINAIVAQIPAQKVARLAQEPGVTWISLDGPVASTRVDVQTVRDEFYPAAYNNNHGTASWASNWQEAGESDGPHWGDVRIDEYRLLLKDDNNSVTRLVNLSGATSAVLSFDYLRTSLEGDYDYIRLELSNDGGATWTEIDRFAGPANDGSMRATSYDITAYAAANTAVRFTTSASMSDYDYLDIDNLQIEYTFSLPAGDSDPGDDSDANDSNTLPLSLATVRDAFATESYGNNDGSAPWLTNWVEFGDDNNATGGKVKIDHNQLRLEDKSRGVQRTVDLSGATAATLEFLYRRDGMNKAENYVTVEVSVNGGSSWSQLGVIAGPTKDDNLQQISYDLTPYLSAATTIRFRTSSTMGGKLWLDNVAVNFYHNGTAVTSTDTLPADAVRFTTWASAIGPKENMGFSDAQNMIDETSLGPDGHYGLGAGNVKGSFAGFDMQVTPDHQISKVEVVLYGYVATAIPDEELKFKPHLDGDKIVEVKVPSDVLSWNIGPQNAGPVIIDITADRTWLWSDFADALELVIEQSGSGGKDLVYYDAIGLRITSAPGFDHTANTVQPMGDLPKEAIDYSHLLNPFPLAVQAPQVWNEGPSYLQGDGITIAVVDSGIGKTDDLKNRQITDVNFNRGDHESKDRYGHGTIVASVIAADGKKSGGQSVGIAPQSQLLNVRVSDDQGMAYESDVVAALEWIFENRERYNIRIVNLALNVTTPQSYHDSPMTAAVEILWFNGIVVVVSAGNEGTGAVYAPANDPFVITVGATTDNNTAGLADDAVASFSAYGVTQDGFAKPDLVAPGHNIITYLPKYEKLTVGEKHSSHGVEKDYFRMSGTSLSAPMVTGAVALLLQDEPNLTPDQVKYRLMATANQNWPGYDPVKAGAGYLDVYAAVHGTTTESANQDVMPHMMLAKMALIAYWANQNGDDITNWDSVNWGSVDWDNVDWNTVDWNSVNWGSVNWGSVNWGSVNWGSVNWGSVNWGSVNWGSVNWGSVNWGSVNWGSDSWDD